MENMEKNCIQQVTRSQEETGKAVGQRRSISCHRCNKICANTALKLCEDCVQRILDACEYLDGMSKLYCFKHDLEVMWWAIYTLSKQEMLKIGKYLRSHSVPVDVSEIESVHGISYLLLIRDINWDIDWHIAVETLKCINPEFYIVRHMDIEPLRWNPIKIQI
jgi:hypothetical protein